LDLNDSIKNVLESIFLANLIFKHNLLVSFSHSVTTVSMIFLLDLKLFRWCGICCLFFIVLPVSLGHFMKIFIFIADDNHYIVPRIYIVELLLYKSLIVL